jgi:hypothetical protein
MGVNERGHPLHHGTFFLHALLAGDGQHLPAITMPGQHRTTIASDEIATVIGRESCDLERIQSAGEISAELQQVLQSLRFENERAEAARLKMLLHIGGERAKKN